MQLKAPIVLVWKKDIRWFNNVAGYEINIKKSILLIYTSGSQWNANLPTPFRSTAGARRRRALTKSGKNFDYQSGSNKVEVAAWIWTASRKAAAKHPTVRWTSPTSRTNMHLGQKGNNAKAEKLWYILTVRWYNGNEGTFTAIN